MNSHSDGVEQATTQVTVEALVKQVLVGQESLRKELHILKPLVESEDQTDEFLLTLGTLTGDEAQLTEAIAEVKEAVISCGDNWRKNTAKLARCMLIINSVGGDSHMHALSINFRLKLFVDL